MIFRRSRDGCARCAEYVRSEDVEYGAFGECVEDCPYCSGELCGLCGYKPCEHDVSERHATWLIQPPFSAPERCADCPRRSE